MRLFAGVNTHVNRQSRSLNKLFSTTRVVANMRPDAAVDALFGFKLAQRPPTERSDAERAYRDEQDHCAVRILFRKCCRDKPSQGVAAD